MAAAAAAAPAANNEEEQLGFFERMGRIVAPVEAPLPPPVPPSQSLLGSLAQYVAPDPTAAAAADGGARIDEGVEESKSTEPPVSLRLDNCTVSRAAERLLIETDSPYLSPHPHRGQRPNEPALVVHTAACLADVRGISLGELAAVTTANAEALFFSGRAC